jgi:hypothetical protein
MSRLSKLTIKFEEEKKMKVLNILVYEAIAAASAVAILAAAAVGRNKNKKRKGKRNVRGRGQKRRVKEMGVGSSLLLSMVHLRRGVKLIMRRQKRNVEPADPTAQNIDIPEAAGQVENLETE